MLWFELVLLQLYTLFGPTVAVSSTSLMASYETRPVTRFILIHCDKTKDAEAKCFVVDWCTLGPILQAWKKVQHGPLRVQSVYVTLIDAWSITEATRSLKNGDITFSYMTDFMSSFTAAVFSLPADVDLFHLKV